MDIHAAAKANIDYILRAASGPKALLLDDETSGSVSLLYTQSDLAVRDVYLVDPLEGLDLREPLPEFSCLVYVRPTPRNVALLTKELKTHFFSAYYLYFTGPISERDVERLAEADEASVVKDIRELFAGFHALKPNLFSLQSHPNATGIRVADGIVAAVAALKHRPAGIRYQRNSSQCSRLAANISTAFSSTIETLSKEPLPECTVLLVDRFEDACTPLLMPWTYEAMLHEFLTLELNTVTLDKSVEAKRTKKPESNQFVFDASHDAFYAKHIATDWGTLCIEAQKMVEGYQADVDAKAPSKDTNESIEELRGRIARLPKIQRESANVTKHVEAMARIGDAVRARDLFAIGAFEQELMREHSPKEHWRALCALAEKHDGGPTYDMTRIALLFILRYENESPSAFQGGKGFTKNALNVLSGKSLSPSPKKDETTATMVLSMLNAHKLDGELSQKRVHRFLEFYGNSARCMNPMGGQGETFMKTVIGAMKIGGDGEKSMYTQYEPFLTQLAQMAADESLPEEHFPVLPVEYPQNAASPKETDDCDVVVFVVGGLTYTEALSLEMATLAPMKRTGGLKSHFEFLSLSESKSAAKKEGGSLRVVVGTNEMLTTKTFLAQNVE